MSVKTEVRCDHCGGVIVADRTALRAECGPLLGQLGVIDLCGECASALRTWLRSGRINPPARENPGSGVE